MSAPLFSWEEQRTKNIEINPDINFAWQLACTSNNFSDAPEEVVYTHFRRCFETVRTLNESTRRQEREKLLTGNNE